jgi:sarcosine oxidase subunit alpha
VRELDALDEVRVLSRTTALGVYERSLVVAVERRTAHLGPQAPPHLARERLWQLRARHVVLATGAHERPLVFADNDRPGVMLAGAVRTYVNRYAVAPGTRAVVLTNDDSAYAAAAELADAGVDVAAIVDLRADAPVDWRGIRVLGGSAVVGTTGDPALAAVTVAPLVGGGAAETIACDLLAVCGGFAPVVHLYAQAQGRLRYDEARACFVPADAGGRVRCAGAAAGETSLAACLHSGLAAGAEAAAAAGFGDGTPPAPPHVAPAPDGRPPLPVAAVPPVDGDWSRHYVDLHRDATVAELERAVGAGLRSVEHVKRYTSIGTGSDQGKTSGLAAAAIAGGLVGEASGALGTTTFRPPYTPVSFGTVAGRNRGELADPIRVTPIHDWHVERGAVFEDVGQWKRPRYYPLAGEDLEAAVLRECAAVRECVGMMDVSTLGKIELQGPDAGEFLDRMYTNAMATLRVGSCRYGLVCTADGMVLDDGVVMRLAEDRFLATTTTGGAASMLDWFEEWLQTEWPELNVRCTSVTEQWAVVAVVGPRARDVLAGLTELPVDNDSFPFMAIREGEVAGIPARVCRVSFSGELAYEVNVAGWYGRDLWEAIAAAGAPHGITPYGTETMHVLRAEKGYVIVGQDTDGTVTPLDLGMAWMVSKTKPDFVGRRSLARSDTARPDRKHLVGLLPQDGARLLPEGAQLVLDHDVPPPVPMAGHVTSSYRSAALGRTFALALLESGRERLGSTVYAPLRDGVVAATVTEPVFYDPEGRRRDGDDAA